MQSNQLPLFRKCLELCVYLETIVKGFDKYHKYTIGEDMRKSSKELLYLLNRVGLSQKREDAIRALRDKAEDMKMLLLIAQELKVFRGAKQFEHSSALAVEICKQSQAWLGSTARVAK